MTWPHPILRALHAFLAPLSVLLALEGSVLAYQCPQIPPPAPTEDYQGLHGRVFELGGRSMPYRFFVPEDYDPNTRYPLVLYLHHSGLSGNHQDNDSGLDNCVQLTSEAGSGGYGGVFLHESQTVDGERFNVQEKYPHILVAPHATDPNFGFGGGNAGSMSQPEHVTRPLVYGILDEIRAELNVDARRIYVTGISMGCYGVWDMIMRNPGYFAAASPQSCRGDPNVDFLSPLADMPIWSMCGSNDSYVDGARAMASILEGLGSTQFQYLEMQGVGHSINNRGYDLPGFIDWMFAQSLPGEDPEVAPTDEGDPADEATETPGSDEETAPDLTGTTIDDDPADDGSAGGMTPGDLVSDPTDATDDGPALDPVGADPSAQEDDVLPGLDASGLPMATNSTSGGCSVARGSPAGPALLPLLALAGFGALVRRRRRGGQSDHGQSARVRSRGSA